MDYLTKIIVHYFQLGAVLGPVLASATAEVTENLCGEY